MLTSNQENMRVEHASLLYSGLPLVSMPRPAARSSLAMWRARRALDYVEENLGMPITVSELAQRVNLSASHFSRGFKQTFGVTVHAYLMRRRVEAAKVMMAGTSAGLSDIAIRCGLSDQSHLTRWFRRVVGVTPGSWRRSHRKGLSGTPG